MTAQSKSYWDILHYDSSIVAYHLVCLKCGAYLAVPVADNRNDGFKPCGQCVYPICEIQRCCQHQLDGFTNLLDWVDTVNPLIKDSRNVSH